MDLEFSRSELQFTGKARAFSSGRAAARASAGGLTDRLCGRFTVGSTAPQASADAIQIRGGIAVTRKFSSSLPAKRLIQIGQQDCDADRKLIHFVALAAA